MQLVSKVLDSQGLGDRASPLPIYIQRLIDEFQPVGRHHHMIVPFVVFAYNSFLKCYLIIHQQLPSDNLTPGTVVIGIFIYQLAVDVCKFLSLSIYSVVEAAGRYMPIALIPFYKLVVDDVRMPCLNTFVQTFQDSCVYQVVIAVNVPDILALCQLRSDVTRVCQSTICFMNNPYTLILLCISLTNLRTGVGASVINKNNFKISECLL